MMTNNCNLNCRYCFTEQSPEYIDLNTAKKAADYLYNNLCIQREKYPDLLMHRNIASIVFFGGEPMLAYDTIIVPLVNYIEEKYPNDFTFAMTTNMTLMTEQKLEFFVKHNFSLLQSIDGDKITQDYNRPTKNNTSSFDIIFPKIPTILKYYPEIVFRSTIAPQTVKYVFDNYLFAEQQGYKKCFMIPNFREKWTLQQLEELKKQIDKIFYYRYCLFKKNIIPPLESAHSISFYSDIIIADMNKYPILDYKNHIKCGLGLGGVAIGVDGAIYGCQEKPTHKEKDIFYLGNINSGIDIIKHKKLLETYFNSPQNQCADDPNLCNNCICKNQCYIYDKICPSSSFEIYNNFYHKNIVECIFEQEIYKNCLLHMKLLTKENNKTFQTYLNMQCGYQEILNKHIQKGESSE